MPQPGIIVHGGAGDIDPDRHSAARAGCRRAVEAGLNILRFGGGAVEAAQASVRVLEDDPCFNAGVGSVLSRAGTVEMDAAIMDGKGLRFGAVAAMPNVARAIEVARAIMEDGEHAVLCGEGAWAFARERGFAPSDPESLITERSRRRHSEAEAAGGAVPTWRVDPGTVGACALDLAGNVAAATSTGGITHKRVGRIGDTPMCGCGTYAENGAGAASATGHGEAIMRATLALRCINSARAERDMDAAAWRSVDELGALVHGQGGIVCIDSSGQFGAAHNSANMAFAAGRTGAPHIVDGVRVTRQLPIAALYGACG